MRRLAAQFDCSVEDRVHRIVSLDNLAAEWTADLRFLVIAKSNDECLEVQKLQRAGLENVFWLCSDGILEGDVVVPQTRKCESVVLYRESDMHHSLLLTNRCNSFCLMCSQPPTKHDDAWLVEEALDVNRHIRESPRVFGLTGGEPLLLGGDLRRILDAVSERHPSTRIEVLTNGRMLGESGAADLVLRNLPAIVTWLIPLYGHADFLHDFVVQSPGAYEQTLAGLLVLQEHRQPIQLRTVLIEPVLRILPDLCTFIGKNLPFIREVALMACEPIGFALANREHCAVDLADWDSVLLRSARILDRYSIPYLFMNTPLCALPRDLWPRAHKSISDWKNTFAPACADCAVRNQCSGLFAWHESGWKPTQIRPIAKVEA